MTMKRINLKTSVVSAILVTTSTIICSFPGTANAGGKGIKFYMQPSGAAQQCLPNATAKVIVKNRGPIEIMYVEAKNLPPKTEFDFFVIQVPKAPFGLSWYQGDMETDEKGKATAVFVGRFNEETFIVAPGSDVAPQTHKDSPFPDADTNPPTGSVHTYHLGLWFNSPDDALKAGCKGDVTPFNGEHNAGIQVLNTAQFQPDQGPLFFLKP